uniref:Transthyretin-like family-containing protein n=1 Tax=Meloidogyne floridensis TaxID=298350 RepID=A0A915PCX4_9BILA
MFGLINILFLFFFFNFSTSEVVHLKGKLTCAGKSLTKASIELLEADLFEPDDLLGITNTDSKGFYEIKGEQNEWFGKIDPYLRIKHNSKDDLIEDDKNDIDFHTLEVAPSNEECTEDISSLIDSDTSSHFERTEDEEDEENEEEKRIERNDKNLNKSSNEEEESLFPATTTLNNSEIETTEKQKEEEGILITTTEINNNETKGEQVKQPPSTQPY